MTSSWSPRVRPLPWLLGMSSSAPTNSAFINTRDPYQLERLAEELANRETNQRNNASPSDVDIKYTDLPDYGPLSHHNPLLTGPVFNVEEFLLSRARASLPELRTELRDYLSVLKEELVQLINNDYEAFISLSTDLRSEGSRLKKMRGPLVDLQDRIMVRLLLKLVCVCSSTERVSRTPERSCKPYKLLYRRN